MKYVKPELTRWRKMDISLQNYTTYLSIKPNRFSLDLVDLLYISNFKGGNASIHVSEKTLSQILPRYTHLLLEIEKEFASKTLACISEIETTKLIAIVEQVFDLCDNIETAVDGFKTSYLSALLHSYFPKLIPIIDRRVLVSMLIINENDLDKQKQVRNIRIIFPTLISKVQKICKQTGRSVREVDEEYFSVDLPSWAKKRGRQVEPLP